MLDARNYRDYERRGLDPLDQKKVVICSYNFAARKKDEIKRYLAIYFEASMEGDHIPDVDGEQWYEVTEDEEE